MPETMTEVGTIIVTLEGDAWCANFVGEATILDLFGTTKLVTAWTSGATAAEVLAGLRELNPGHVVVVDA